MEDFVEMIKVGKRRLLACLALCAVLALILAAGSDAALFGLIKSKGNAQPAVKHSLMVFPFDRDSELTAVLPDDFGAGVADYLRITLASSKGYATYIYDERLTPVKRANADNMVKDQDMKAPFFTEKAKVTKLAEILATEYFLVGSIESYTFDKDKKTVDLTLKADLYSSKTGKVVQEFVVGGSAGEGAQGLEEDELRSIAAGKAVEALREKIIGTSAADAKPAAKKTPAVKKTPVVKTAPTSEKAPAEAAK